VVGLAGIAGAISYSHMRALAQGHGQAGWHAHAFPLSVDGVEIVASLVLLADRRVGRRSGWLPWAALFIGTVGSLAANVATAGPGTVSRLIAGWPALALLIAVKLLSGLLDRHAAHGQAAPPGTLPSQLCADGTKAGDGAFGQAVPARTRPARASGQPVPRRVPSGDRSAVAPGRAGTAASQRATDQGTGIAALLPAARAARDGLQRDGRPLTRDALAAWLRQNGHPVRNSRLTPLLHALRNEATPKSPHGHSPRIA
jgi:hypothetical protein